MKIKINFSGDGSVIIEDVQSEEEAESRLKAMLPSDFDMREVDMEQLNGNYRAYFTVQGFVEVRATSEADAETKARDILNDHEHKQIQVDDSEVHCAEEVS